VSKDDDDFLAYLVPDDGPPGSSEPIVHVVHVDDVVQIKPKGGPYDGAFVRVTSVDGKGNIVGYVPVPVVGGMRRVIVRVGSHGVHRIGRAVYQDREAPPQIKTAKTAKPTFGVDRYGYKT
jgi:hypothetical protein